MVRAVEQAQKVRSLLAPVAGGTVATAAAGGVAAAAVIGHQGPGTIFAESTLGLFAALAVVASAQFHIIGKPPQEDAMRTDLETIQLARDWLSHVTGYDGGEVLVSPDDVERLQSGALRQARLSGYVAATLAMDQVISAVSDVTPSEPLPTVNRIALNDGLNSLQMLVQGIE
jgi:hypothetical protein